MPRLEVIRGSEQGRVFESDELPITIGRAEDSVIRLPDDMVSRYHAQISLVNGAYVIKDLVSANGTFVNGQLVTEDPLALGDEIRVGHTVLVFGHRREQEGAERRESLTPAGALEPHSTAATIIATARAPEPTALIESLSPTDVEVLDRARRSLRTIYQVSAVLSATTHPKEVLDRVLEMVYQVVKSDHALIMLREGTSGQLDPEPIRRRSDQQDDKYVISTTITSRVLETAEGLLTRNALLDERFRRGQSIVAGNIHSAMCAPIGCHDQVLGIIYVYNDSNSASFTREDLEMLVAIGNEAGVALENARLLEAYVRAERFAAVGSAVAGLSHYIKNIINGMQAGSMVVQMAMESRDMEGLHKGWEIVRGNQNKIRDLVMDMLNYAKEREVRFELVNLNDIVEDVLEMMTAKLQSRGVTLEKDFSAQVRQCFLDPVGIHRALLNLVSNAIDAIKHKEGQIVVRSALDESRRMLELSVQDNGSGISAEVLPHIFEAFYSSKGSEGTGLGLAVTDKIVKEHMGTIEVESEEGKGTTFIMHLPYSTEAPVQRTSAQ